MLHESSSPSVAASERVEASEDSPRINALWTHRLSTKLRKCGASCSCVRLSKTLSRLRHAVYSHGPLAAQMLLCSSCSAIHLWLAGQLECKTSPAELPEGWQQAKTAG